MPHLFDLWGESRKKRCVFLLQLYILYIIFLHGQFFTLPNRRTFVVARLTGPIGSNGKFAFVACIPWIVCQRTNNMINKIMAVARRTAFSCVRGWLGIEMSLHCMRFFNFVQRQTNNISCIRRWSVNLMDKIQMAYWTLL